MEASAVLESHCTAATFHHDGVVELSAVEALVLVVIVELVFEATIAIEFASTETVVQLFITAR